MKNCQISLIHSFIKAYPGDLTFPAAVYDYGALINQWFRFLK